jgi:hypothetical protein
MFMHSENIQIAMGVASDKKRARTESLTVETCCADEAPDDERLNPRFVSGLSANPKQFSAPATYWAVLHVLPRFLPRLTQIAFMPYLQDRRLRRKRVSHWRASFQARQSPETPECSRLS